ncbi:MAG TPA: hypothetical protein VIR64_04600, partial [Pseudobacillus sp.]
VPIHSFINGQACSSFKSIYSQFLAALAQSEHFVHDYSLLFILPVELFALLNSSSSLYTPC